MAESGNRPAVRISQKRMTIVVAVLGLLGCIVLGLVWWDSVSNTTAYSTEKRAFIIDSSSVVYAPQSLKVLGFNKPYLRGNFTFYLYSDHRPLFPSPEISSSIITIPIYLLILAYLATLLLIWFVLMNRLARSGCLWGNRSSNERA